MTTANVITIRREQPPQLGDVEFSNGAGDAWSVYRHGELVRDDLAFEQVLAIVRGELAIDDLVPAGTAKGAGA